MHRNDIVRETFLKRFFLTFLSKSGISAQNVKIPDNLALALNLSLDRASDCKVLPHTFLQPLMDNLERFIEEYHSIRPSKSCQEDQRAAEGPNWGLNGQT